MMDFVEQGFPLGRVMGTRIVVSFSHIIMLLYLGWSAESYGVAGIVVYAFIYFISILLHEFGHVLACRSVGGHADQVVLGPMGGLAYVQPPDKPLAHFITTAGGPAVNGILLAIFWGLMRVPSIADFLANGTPLAEIAWVFMRGMIIINQLLLVFNLLPIYPMDGGRLVQHLLWPIAGYRNSMEVTAMLGTVGGAALMVLGFGIWQVDLPFDFSLGGHDGNADYWLVIIGLTCLMASWQLYLHARNVASWRKK